MNSILDKTSLLQRDLSPRDGNSHVTGPELQPLAFTSISKLLRDAAKRDGSREALSCPNNRLNYYDFDPTVDALAAGFLALGLDKGDRLGIWSPIVWNGFLHNLRLRELVCCL